MRTDVTRPPFASIKSPSSSPNQPILTSIDYDEPSGVVTLNYDRTLAGLHLDSPAGLAVFSGPTPMPISFINIDDEDQIATVQLELPVLIPDSITYTGDNPQIQDFATGTRADPFNKPIPFA